MSGYTKLIYCGILVLGFSTTSSGAIALSNGTPTYNQDFNTLATVGTTNTTVPTDWAFVESGTGANSTYSAGTGSGSTGDTFSFGSTGASSADRAFGGLQSGTVIPTIGASFSNGGSTVLTDLAISYTGEQWRLGATARADRLDFQYSLDATSLTTGTWTDVNLLDFTAPITAGSTGPLDGNLAANRTAVSGTISSLSIAIGNVFWIRWNDFNATGSDDGLGVDDFRITATFASIPEPSAYLFGALATMLGGGATFGRRLFARS